MSLDRQIVRLMTAMILAIIAYAAPPAVQAHEGHAHHGHHAAAAQPKVPAPEAAAPAVSGTPKLAVRAGAPAWARIALAPTMVEGARIEPAQDECCPVGCKTRCSGTMACCATGVLSGPFTLAPTLFRTVTLIPRDVS